MTGYADAVFEAFHEGFLSNLLKNLAELDWRITQRDPQTRLLENIWIRLRETFSARQAHGRRQMLMEMQKVVPFSQLRCIAFSNSRWISRRRRAMTLASRLVTIR